MATAASKALPPYVRMAAPTSAARGCGQTTTPFMGLNALLEYRAEPALVQVKELLQPGWALFPGMAGIACLIF